MLGQNTDREWEKFGQTDPYFGVLSDDKFKIDNLTDEGKQEFFDSGVAHVYGTLEEIHKCLDPSFQVQRALDFGCGVGRLVIPLAQLSKQVVGVDVSPSMLQEARRNCAERAIENVDFVLSNDTLSQVTGQFNYIQSFLVFQHIPVPRGEQLLHHLLELLAIGGVGVFHFTYSADPSTLRAIANVLRSWVPFSANVINVIKGQSWQTPQAQMNNYNLNRVMDIFTRHQVNQVQVQIMDQDGYRSVVLYVQKGL